MAKIKVSGYSELIELDNARAKQLDLIWRDGAVDDDEKLTVGRVSILKKDIKGIFFDVEQQSLEDKKFQVNVAKYYQRRKDLLAFSSRERAEQTAWGPFKIFYWSWKFEWPADEWKEKCIVKATEFFDKNPEWSRPSCMIWFELLGVDKSAKLRDLGFRILERQEAGELQEIEDAKKEDSFQNKLLEQETKVLQKQDEDTPF